VGKHALTDKRCNLSELTERGGGDGGRKRVWGERITGKNKTPTAKKKREGGIDVCQVNKRGGGGSPDASANPNLYDFREKSRH